MKMTLKYAGINTPENSRRLSEMIARAWRSSPQEDMAPEKAIFIKTAEKQESQFLAQGFERA